MNNILKVTQLNFQSKWGFQGRFVKNTIFNQKRINYKRIQFRKLKNDYPLWNLIKKIKGTHVLLASAIVTEGKLTVEDDLYTAVKDGEAAILELMDELRDLIITVSKEYRDSLSKQIDIIKKTGDEASAELPHFRTLAHALSNELNEYVILLKTLGEIAYDQTLLSMAVGEEGIEKILKGYKQLEILLLNEFEKNKQKELELLEANIAKIKSK